MDGTGTSGIIYTPIDAQIYCFNLEQNSGSVKCGLNIAGSIYWVHQFQVANVLTCTNSIQLLTPNQSRNVQYRCCSC